LDCFFLGICAFHASHYGGNHVVIKVHVANKAEHVLGALLLETEWETAGAIQDGKDAEKAQKIYIHKLQKVVQDFGFRKNSFDDSRPIILCLNKSPADRKSTFLIVHCSGTTLKSASPTERVGLLNG
jgi:hypothetical protein